MTEHLTDVDQLQWGTPEQVKFVIGFVQATKRTGAERCPLHVDFLLAALAELERLRINAAVDERLDRVERELAASMVARCEHGNPIDPTGGYVCLKCFRAPSTTGEGQ